MLLTITCIVSHVLLLIGELDHALRIALALALEIARDQRAEMLYR